MPKKQLNVFGTSLKLCNLSPVTGYRRNGFCMQDNLDHGTHVVCSVVTKEFLMFTLSQGNDLISSTSSFPGLQPGDKWCLCALRWMEAYRAGKAPYVVGESTNIGALEYIPSKILQKYLID